MRTPTFGMRVRHIKRGSTYMVTGRAKIQISARTLAQSDFHAHNFESVCQRLEMITFITYVCDADNAIWARPESEFCDGRFEEVLPSNDRRVDMHDSPLKNRS